MSITYRSEAVRLVEVLRDATIDATYVIPDLQRPFVWKPSEVSLLIDSLFRGWPFGSLLIWEVRKDCFGEKEGIPSRPFWHVVDRTIDDPALPPKPKGWPCDYRMVLDGQQRLQSLVLALGWSQWGFTEFDDVWALDLQGRRVKHNPAYKSSAVLCIDLELFAAEVAQKEGKVRRIEVGKILQWVTQRRAIRPATFEHPLPSYEGSPGRFVRLSEIWDLVQEDLTEAEYGDQLRGVLTKFSVADPERFVTPLAQFAQVVGNVKRNAKVHLLLIESFRVSSLWTRDDYSEAIVNIFSRLNSQGRLLTREEITLAWLKVGWVNQPGGEPAGKSLESLRLALNETGLKLGMDDVVRLLSFIWAVDERDGRLLLASDLTKGEVIRPMAEWLSAIWADLRARLLASADLIRVRDLVDQLGSFNAAIVFFAWHRLVSKSVDTQNHLQVPDLDRLRKQADQLGQQFLDRWVFGSQWAGVWGESANFESYARLLSAALAEDERSVAGELPASIRGSVAALMDKVAQGSVKEVQALAVASRNKVSQYRGFLWVWHRLDPDRWEQSAVQMLTGRCRVVTPEVDHTVADRWWQGLVEESMNEKIALFSGTEEERNLLAPDGFESRSEALAFVNRVGNCSLLSKSFNVSKSAEPMWTFMSKVHEFRPDGPLRRDEWERALKLTPALTDPTGRSLGELKALIEEREALMKAELVDFVNGRRFREDVS